MNEDALEKIFQTYNTVVSEFTKTFENTMTSMDIRHQKERKDLCDLHKNYKRMLLRTGYSEDQVSLSFEKVRQQQLRTIRRKLKRKRQDILFDQQAKSNVYKF